MVKILKHSFISIFIAVLFPSKQGSFTLLFRLILPICKAAIDRARYRETVPKVTNLCVTVKNYTAHGTGHIIASFAYCTGRQTTATLKKTAA